MSELSHNTYFDGAVQSIGYERLGQRQTIGAMAPGEYEFGTGAPERVTVVSGALTIRQPGSDEWVRYPAGTVFEVIGDSSFGVRVEVPSAYLCEYL